MTLHYMTPLLGSQDGNALQADQESNMVEAAAFQEDGDPEEVVELVAGVEADQD